MRPTWLSELSEAPKFVPAGPTPVSPDHCEQDHALVGERRTPGASSSNAICTPQGLQADVVGCIRRLPPVDYAAATAEGKTLMQTLMQTRDTTASDARRRAPANPPPPLVLELPLKTTPSGAPSANSEREGNEPHLEAGSAEAREPQRTIVVTGPDGKALSQVWDTCQAVTALPQRVPQEAPVADTEHVLAPAGPPAFEPDLAAPPSLPAEGDRYAMNLWSPQAQPHAADPVDQPASLPDRERDVPAVPEGPPVQEPEPAKVAMSPDDALVLENPLPSPPEPANDTAETSARPAFDKEARSTDEAEPERRVALSNPADESARGKPQEAEEEVDESVALDHASAQVPGESESPEPRREPPRPPNRIDGLLLHATQARHHVQQGFGAANRGMLFTARKEFLRALRIIAEARDARNGHPDSVEALAAGLKAVEEAERIREASSTVADVDLSLVTAAHHTPVLKDQDVSDMLPLAAIDEYHEYARQQLADAVAGDPTGSMALYGLARIYEHLGSENGADRVARSRQAVAFHEAALLAHPENHLAAHELGIVLARLGRFEQAIARLTRSIQLAPTSNAYHNLATVSRQYGRHRQAALAERYAAQMAQREMAAGQTENRVKWLEPSAFARTSEQTAIAQAVTRDGPQGAAAKDATKETSRAASDERHAWWKLPLWQ